MMGESISGAIEIVVGPFAGESDDLVFTPAGDLIWTAVLGGAARMRTVDGRIRDLATELPGCRAPTRSRSRGTASACSSARSSWVRGSGRST